MAKFIYYQILAHRLILKLKYHENLTTILPIDILWMVMESLTFVWHLGPFANLNSTCGIGMDYILIRIVKVRLQVGNLQFILFLPRFHCKWTKTNGSPALLSNQIMQKNEIASFTLNIFSSDKYLTLMLVIKMVGNHATNINSFRYVSLLFFWSLLESQSTCINWYKWQFCML